MIVFWGTALLGLATALLAFGLLIRSLFVRTRRRSLLLTDQGEKGKGGAVRITEDSVVSCVETSLRHYEEILDIDVRPSLHKKKTGNSIRLRILAGIPDHGQMGPLVESIQDTVRRDVENYTGLPVEKIDIKLDAVDSKQGREGARTTAVPRKKDPSSPDLMSKAPQDPLLIDNPEPRPSAESLLQQSDVSRGSEQSLSDRESEGGES